MANEITFSGSLIYASGRTRAVLAGAGSDSIAGSHYVQEVQDVGTTEEQLAKGDIGTIGWVAFRNLDATNFVQLGPATTVYSLKLLPGQFHGPVKWNGSAVYAKADTAACKLEFLLIEL